ncbi:hypothetical protein [Phenylobacterium sp.]|jgi:hypothetical protein|uniref:hypothetical protein n=1 Tax=Phenylobacterium sp. TaxID=1871053 RepID=UPI002F92222F
MTRLLFLAASTLALTGLSACAPGKLQTRAALDCPQTEGELTRTGVSPDGKRCTYTTSGGAEVTLQLVSTAGDPAQALQQIEDGLLPPASPEQLAADAAGRERAAASATAQAAGAPSSAADAEAAARQAEADAARPSQSAAAEPEKRRGATARVEVMVDDDGHVDAKDTHGDDVTRVRLPGVSITAGDESAKVQVGGITIDADGDADQVTIRSYDQVRLKGEALAREKRGVRATLVRKGEFPGGYRVVGYEAGGPKLGPITVATVRAKSELDEHGGDVYDDVKRLVRRNGGV